MPEVKWKNFRSPRFLGKKNPSKAQRRLFLFQIINPLNAESFKKLSLLSSVYGSVFKGFFTFWTFGPMKIWKFGQINFLEIFLDKSFFHFSCCQFKLFLSSEQQKNYLVDRYFCSNQGKFGRSLKKFTKLLWKIVYLHLIVSL